MSHFFKDVGDILTAPVRTIYGAVTGNPKYNSIGDIYDQTLGPENPVASAFSSEGLNKASRIFSAPSWDALGKPGEAFANFVDTQNSILPADWRQYAQPVESALLNFVPGVGPLLSAGYNTAYQGGKEQQLNKGFDWGELGKNAAINFGTAAATMGASSLLKNANLSQAAKTNFGTPLNSTTAGLNAGNALDPFTTAADASANFAPSLTAENLAANSATAFNGINSVPAAANVFTGFNTASSPSNIPQAQAAQSSGGVGDGLYKAGVGASPKLVNDVLTNTLAPQASQSITGAGALDGFSPNDSGGYNNGLKFGDILNAFGGDVGTNPNSSGVRIDSTALDTIGQRLAANNYLQQSQARDTALPAGQYIPDQNTPYANRLSEINKGTDQTFSDLLNEVGNYNKYYSVIDSNPGITEDQFNTYLNDPSTGLIGDFTVPQDQSSFFQGLRPINPLNTSLVR